MIGARLLGITFSGLPLVARLDRLLERLSFVISEYPGTYVRPQHIINYDYSIWAGAGSEELLRMDSEYTLSRSGIPAIGEESNPVWPMPE